MTLCRNNFFKLSVGASLLLIASSGLAAGFGLLEESVSLMGNEYAGAAAKGSNASVEYYNAAQAVMFKHSQVSAGAVILPVEMSFTGDWELKFVPGFPFSKAAHVDNNKANSINVIPNFHFVTPVSGRLSFAFGVTAPFGLKSSYDVKNWKPSPSVPLGPVGAPTLTSITGINFNPSLAYAISSNFAFAAGFDAMHGEATYNGTLAALGGELKNALDGWGYGYNLGVLYQVNKDSRVGLSYRSPVDLKANGSSELVDEKTGQPLRASNANATLKLPGVIMLSGYHRFDTKWSIDASVFYNTWGRLDNLKIANVIDPLGTTEDMNTNLHFRNTWFYSLGADYQLNTRWGVSMGLGYDQTPSQDGYRDTRMPDADRYVVALGAHWQATSKLSVDAGYQHIFSPTAKIDARQRSNNKGGSAPAYYAVGTAKTQADLFGIQLSYRLG